MKKIIVLLTVIIAALCLTACQTKEEIKISYEIGASSISISSTEDMYNWNLVEGAYSSEISKLGFKKESGTYFTATGFPDECDAKVLAACSAAESKVSGIKFTDGYVTMEVTAIYWDNGKTKVLYSHTF